MRDRSPGPMFRPAAGLMLAAAAALVLAPARPARAGKLAWLDEVVQEVIQEAKAGGKAAARGLDTPAERAAGRLFVREADQSLEALARRADDLGRAAGRGTADSAVMEARFARLVKAEPEMARTFHALAPAEKRLVVEMGETAQRLARRHPAEAETLIRKLGTEGLTAVRVYGDDVAEVIAEEGPQSINVLRKTGRSGWAFFTEQVLPHKKKLAAAGVLALFLADPDRFLDTAGNVTEFAVREFGRAGVKLAGAVAGGAARGLDSAIAGTLAAYGIHSEALRYAGMALACLVIFGATMVLLGLPVAWVFRPLTWPIRRLWRHRHQPARTA